MTDHSEPDRDAAGAASPARDAGETTAGDAARSVLSRRRLLAATGAVGLGAIAGCSGDGGSSCSAPEDLSGPVPEAYRTATSEGDVTRKPDELISKAEADYQREPNGEQRCERCSYYVPDKNDDCAGACVRVEGLVDPQGYCQYYRTQVGGGW